MKILMRMGMSPFYNISLYEVVSQDTIGTNSGNILFPYSIMRNIYETGMEIVAYKNANPLDAEKINNTYDMFLIPLANAFRNDFIGELRNLTKLIKKLSIPCVVIGVGLQAGYEPDFNKKNKWDPDVKEFVSAVLDKSCSIGVRGNITATYLKKLGFTEDKIHVIGCPSMFLYGDFLPLKKPVTLSNKTKVAINYHGGRNNYFNFLERVKMEFSDYYYVLQKIYELRLLYAGDKVQENHFLNKYYVGSIENESFKKNKMRMFITVPSWIDFLSKMDISVGSCIHGSIASVLSGNPTILFANDSRVRELAEYHNITMENMESINNETNIKSIFDHADFSLVLKGHADRYQNFRNFLLDNGVPCKKISYGVFTEFDKKIKDMNINGEIQCYNAMPLETQKTNMKKYLKLCDGKIKWCVNAVNKGQKEFEKNIVQWEKSKQCVCSNLEKLS